MAITLSKPPRSGRSNFFHDLVTVDFHQSQIKWGVKFATLLIIPIVLGLITGHVAEASYICFTAAFVLEQISFVLMVHEHASC